MISSFCSSKNNKRLVLLISAILSLPFFCFADRVTITTNPQNAEIYINGTLKATGKLSISISKNDCAVIEVRAEGYTGETKNICNKKNLSTPKSLYIQLQADESFNASSTSGNVNQDVPIYPKPTKTKEEAWKQVVATVLSKFDVIELNDEKAGYLRTSWVGVSYKTNTVRTRLIIKTDSDDPIVFKIKLVSEESGKAGTPYLSDEQYRPWTRMLKRYNDFIEELAAKLRN